MLDILIESCFAFSIVVERFCRLIDYWLFNTLTGIDVKNFVNITCHSLFNARISRFIDLFVRRTFHKVHTSICVFIEEICTFFVWFTCVCLIVVELVNALKDIFAYVLLAVEELITAVFELFTSVGLFIKEGIATVSIDLTLIFVGVVEFVVADNHLFALVLLFFENKSWLAFNPVNTFIARLIQVAVNAYFELLAVVVIAVEKHIRWAGYKWFTFECLTVEVFVITAIFHLLTLIGVSVEDGFLVANTIFLT
jgi:hypothetical protein